MLLVESLDAFYNFRQGETLKKVKKLEIYEIRHSYSRHENILPYKKFSMELSFKIFLHTN